MTPTRSVLLTVLFALGAISQVSALELPKTSADADSAINWLRNQGRLEEAREVGAAWLKKNPQDGQIVFADAYTILLQSMTEPDAAKARSLRKQVFAKAQKARDLGCNHALLEMLLSVTDKDGNDLQDPKRLSSVPEAAAELEKGEQAFVKRDFETAEACYRRALTLDPHSYKAALFIGDIYFVQRKYPDAIEWFTKATTLDPNRETAHRYLGDAYMKWDKPKEARSAYVNALVASPYSRLPREALSHYARVTRKSLNSPKVDQIPGNVSIKNGEIAIEVDPSNGALAMAYAIGRAGWLAEQSEKYFAKSAKPRHSLYEECAGLRLIITTADEIPPEKDEKPEKLRPSIAVLKSLEKAGLLEAFVLLDRPDEGIAQDYEAYRQLHRDVLVRYINEIWFAEAQK